jgi:hypothetical protein
MLRSSGVKLVAHGGHSHWADPSLRPLNGGYALGAEPQTHWLAPGPAHPGHCGSTDSQHVWPCAVNAFTSLDAYREQE